MGIRPNVEIIKTNGNLGRVAPSEDGIAALVVSGVAIGGQFALGDVIGPFNELADAEAKGIDAAYDATNQAMAWQHVNDFYKYAPKGAELYLMVVDPTVLMDDICNELNDYAAKMLRDANGKIKLLGITRVPDGAYSPTFTEGFEDDLWLAVQRVQELADAEFDRFRPVDVIMEGRNWQGDPGATRDLKDAASSPNANAVMIVMGADQETQALGAWAEKAGAVGVALGVAATCAVNRSIARVKNGALKMLTVGFSNGAAYNTLTDNDLDTLSGKGYVFFVNHVGKSGYFFNDNSTASPDTDDYYSQDRSRTMNKAARITRTVLLNELNDEIKIDQTTGKLLLSTVKSIQGLVDKAILDSMSKEISGVETFIDPSQDILEDDNLDVQVDITPDGIKRHIKATLSYTNPLNTEA